MDKILLAHGGGGSKSAELTRRVFQRFLRDPLLLEMDDAARLPGPGVHHRQLRGQAAVLPGRRHRPPGRLRHGQRHGGHGRRTALPLHRLHHRRGFSRGAAGKDPGLHRQSLPRERRAHRLRRHQGGGKGQGRRPLHQHRRHRPPGFSKNRCSRPRVRPGDVDPHQRPPRPARHFRPDRPRRVRPAGQRSAATSPRSGD